MSESRPQKRKIEFIESYWTGGELGSDYQWNDNHGELVRCKDCRFLIDHYGFMDDGYCRNMRNEHNIKFKPDKDWFCADGKRKESK